MKASDKAKLRQQAEVSKTIAAAYGHLPPGKDLLVGFVKARDRGKPITERALTKIEEAARRILAGESADDVFNMKRGRGRPVDRVIAQRDLAIYFRLANLRHEGNKRDQAIDQVCEEFGLSKAAVRKIDRRFFAGVRSQRPKKNEIVITTNKVLFLP